VLWRLNQHDGPVSNEDVLDVVAAVSSSSAREYAQRYTETSDTPEMWSEAEHGEAFDTQPARMRYDVESYQVTGPFRDETFTSQPTLYVGETLAVSAKVTNDGGSQGSYVVKLGFDDSTLAAVRGELDPTRSDDVALQHQFTEAGTYNLTVGRNTVPVTVREPADPVVDNLSVSPGSVAPGEDVTVTATFASPTAHPRRGPSRSLWTASRSGASTSPSTRASRSRAPGPSPSTKWGARTRGRRPERDRRRQ